MRGITALAVIVAIGLVTGCGGESSSTTSTDANSGSRADHHCPFGQAHSSETFDTRTLKGMDVDRAEDVAASHGCTVRVVKTDGVSPIVTGDLRYDRIDVEVEGTTIVSVLSNGS